MDGLPTSGLARPLEPGVASNRVAVIGPLAAGGLTFAAQLAMRRSGALRAAVASSEACFMAWAIGRELDPDEQSSAILAMPLALAARGFGRPGLGASVPALLGTRIAAGTVGAPLLLADAGAIIGSLVGAVVSRARPRPNARGAGTWIAAVASAALLSIPARSVRSRTDVGGRPLEATRITFARGIAVGAVLLATTLDGRRGLTATVPVAAAAIATGVTRLATFADAPIEPLSIDRQTTNREETT